MHYYRHGAANGPRLIASDGDAAYDLTSVKPDLTTFVDLARTAAITDGTVDEIASGLLDRASSFESTEPARAPAVDEVWAAGVTYEISEQARESESGMPEMYLDVYGAERPEIFFKATPGRTVGPGEAIGVRADSNWNVPEPELGIVLHRGEVVGYTIGNDVSSRDIEGANPLYLPQAKVYDRCCALGPCVASAETVGDPHDLEMSMTISRDGEQVFEGSTSTGEMARTCEELVDYYTRHNAVPERAVLLTGTSIVPPDEFDLQEGDSVSIDIESIGTLENPVVTV
jgi:2-dehydro-3-deoxy-D-arabinonate dehydratase